MTKTNEEMRDEVAEFLRFSGADQALSDYRADQIDRGVQSARAELIELGLCWWPDDAIPAACAFPFKLIVAAQLCLPLGKAGQGYEQGDEGGRARLAKLKPSTNIGPLRVDYF